MTIATNDRSAPVKLLCAGLMAVNLAACDRVSEDLENGAGSDLPEVSAERFRGHMTVLADDTMQGRETGSEGFQLAADYIAAQFSEFGLAPLGDGDGYFQEVPFMTTRLDPEAASLEIWRGEQALELAFGDDFVLFASFASSEESVTAPLVFVGYGVRAPQYGHDDFAGIDASGKILVRITGAPPGFPTDERAFYSSGWVKNQLAVKHGAVGVITLRTPVDLPRLPWRRYLSEIGSSEMRWIGPDGRPFESFPELKGDAVLSEAGATGMFDLAERDLEALFARCEGGETCSFELGLDAKMTRHSVQGRLSAPNVIGLVPGNDPALRGEYLLYTAHLDHLGVRQGESGEEIYNGAYDNAAGVATLLEVARAMASGPVKPGRSVIFAALTGEEKGLQGSFYLSNNMPVALENLVAVINIDMPFVGFPIADIMGLGVEHSSLQDALAGAAAQVGLDYTPDPRPELVRFIRSDQFSFVRRGVPGLNLKRGVRSSDPAFDGAAMHEAFLHDHYHQPADDLDLPFSPQGSAQFARVALQLGLNVADADRRPEWNRGDFFGDQFTNSGGSTNAPAGEGSE